MGLLADLAEHDAPCTPRSVPLQVYQIRLEDGGPWKDATPISHPSGRD